MLIEIYLTVVELKYDWEVVEVDRKKMVKIMIFLYGSTEYMVSNIITICLATLC